MSTDAPVTVAQSLAILSEAVVKSAGDFREVAAILDRVRADLAARNTTVSRDVIVKTTRALDHLKAVDEALRDVVKDLEARD